MSANSACPHYEGLDQMYRKERGWLTAWIRQKMGVSPERAVDLSQDTFLRVLVGKDAHEIQQPRSYLATIARGLAIDLFRRQDLERVYMEYLAVSSLNHAPSPEEHAIVLETLAEVESVLQALGPKVRQAFLLAQVDGLSYAEIAQVIHVSVSSVKKYMAQAMECCLHSQLKLEHALSR